MGKNVKLASGHVTLIEKRSDAQRTKQMHNVKIQVFTSDGTLGVQPVVLAMSLIIDNNHLKYFFVYWHRLITKYVYLAH